MSDSYGAFSIPIPPSWTRQGKSVKTKSGKWHPLGSRREKSRQRMLRQVFAFVTPGGPIYWNGK